MSAEPSSPFVPDPTTRGALEPGLERVSGPYQGFFLASYSVRCDLAYVGYTKICRTQPVDIWDCAAATKVASLPCDTEIDAVDSADEIAKQLISTMREKTGHGVSLIQL